MMMKFEEFSSDVYKNKTKAIDNQKKELQKKLGGLKKQKLQVKMARFNKQQQELQKQMNKYVAGPSNYN